MIWAIQLAVYYAIFIGLLLVFKIIIKPDPRDQRSFFEKGLIYTSVSILAFPLYITIASVCFIGDASDDHYNVKRGSLLWYSVMNNPTITNFPQIEPAGEVKFHHIGGNSLSIAMGWEIEYEAKRNFEYLFPIIKNYLNDEGYTLKEVEEAPCRNWRNYKRSSGTFLYSGTVSPEDCLGLMFKQKDSTILIKASIIY